MILPRINDMAFSFYFFQPLVMKYFKFLCESLYTSLIMISKKKKSIKKKVKKITD